MKQIQDAYIVAATRTPIGRSHRGYFRNTRPDDLLATALRAAMAQVPSLDPQAVEDVICGCAIPEAQQGLNVARIGAVLAHSAAEGRNPERRRRKDAWIAARPGMGRHPSGDRRRPQASHGPVAALTPIKLLLATAGDRRRPQQP